MTGVVAFALGKDGPHWVAATLILMFFAWIWSLWIRGLWSRRNWVRWLTVISNVVASASALRLIAAENDRTQTLISCLQIVMVVPATAMFLLPVATGADLHRTCSRGNCVGEHPAFRVDKLTSRQRKRRFAARPLRSDLYQSIDSKNLALAPLAIERSLP